MLKKIKEKFKNSIENLCSSNEPTFGNGSLDCCDLNFKKKGEKNE